MNATLNRIESGLVGKRVPLHGSAELTWKCNFACIHCYQEGLRHTKRDLDTAKWKSILDEMADAGCLFLTLTGGDPLVRKDFAEIYAHAHQRGFLITVFTNGALITPELIDLWTQRPPRGIEITLYGMSEESYQRVAQRQGFAKVMRSIDALVAAKLPLTLKAVALRPIAGELLAMRQLAKSKGVGFRWDANITPRLDGNRDSQKERLTPAEMLDLEAQDLRRLREFDTCAGNRVPGDDLLACGATKSAFNIDPAGVVSGCPILRSPSASAVEGGFMRAWEALGTFSRSKYSMTEGTCGTCSSRGVCTRCPGVSQLEHANVETPVPHHCELTQLRFARTASEKRQ